MKKIGSIVIKAVLILFAYVGPLLGAPSEYYKYFRTDSAHVYSWNSVISQWTPSSVQLYSYNQGQLLLLTTLDYITRAEQGRTEYLYNSSGRLDTEVNYFYNGGWIASTRLIYSYDQEGRVSEIRIQKWNNSIWIDDRIQMNYVYDSNSRQMEFQLIYWRNNAWTLPTTDYSFYNDNGLLIRREAIYPTGSTDYQVIYSYDAFDVLSEVYSQYPIPTGWQNWWLINYQYNPCGLKVSQVRYTGVGSEWVPGSRVVSFSYFKPDLCPDRKVPMCQNGTTIYVKKTVVPTRLAKGDCIGTCPDTKGESKSIEKISENKNLKAPFSVYPNPATDHINVRQLNNEEQISRVELSDMNGKLMRVISNPGSETTIYKRELASGQYIIKIYARETYTLQVIFK